VSDNRVIGAEMDAPGQSGWRWDWLNGRRVRAYSVIVLIATVGVGVVRVAMALAGTGPLGFELTSDYLSFWAASHLALSGHALDVYSIDRHWAAQREVIADAGYSAFLYPPIWLLMCLPLALLPFWWSLVAFLGATGAGYWWVFRRIMPGSGVAALACPAVAMNVVFGQNGLLTTALFGGGVLALQRQPWLAGICFGCLAYKPHLAAIAPIALIAGRHWRALAAMMATVAALIAASLALFGVAAWQGFFAEAPFARSVLEHGLVVNYSWESFFRAVVQMGGSVTTAYVVQGFVALLAVSAMIVAIRQRPDAIIAVLPLATLLASPFLLAYDLALLALPMAWLGREGLRRGFRGWEKPVLCLAFLTPIASIPASAIHLPVLGPLVMSALLALTMRAVQR
jgi:hypothetical protein